MTVYTDHATKERLEMIQNVIDRLLYLKDDKKNEFIGYLETLFDVYEVKYQEINGIRVYERQK
jgi:hypothetical protein